MVGATARHAWLLVFVLVTSAALSLSDARAARFGDWVTLESKRYGYSISYPRSVFSRRDSRSSDEGYIFVSGDGRARLLVGAFANQDDMSLREYRTFILENNYDGLDIDYAPVRRRWFVVSGERDGSMFYERVSFKCRGRLINSWAMVYPVAERRFYDRVVEAIARKYRAGAGPDNSCDVEAF